MARVQATGRTFASSDTITQVGVSPDINCHQGITTDGTYFYGIDTGTIYKYDSAWNLITSNTHANTDTGISHLGDGQYFDGKLYLAAENYSNETTFSNMRIAVFDAGDLSFIEYHDISAQGHEISSVCIDSTDDSIYATDYTDGSKIHRYSLSDFTYLGPITLSSTAHHAQGISINDKGLWISRGIPYFKLHHIRSDGSLVKIFDMSGFTEFQGIDYTTETLYALDDTGAIEQVKSFQLVSLHRNTTGDMQASLAFTGSTSVRISGLSPNAAAFGVGFWIYLPQNYTNQGKIFSWHDGTRGIDIFLRKATVWRLSCNINTGNNIQLVYGLGEGMFNRWSHIVINLSESKLSIYFNGRLVGYRDNSSVTAAIGQTFTIGRSSNSNTDFFLGKLANFTWRNQPFTTREVTDLYEVGSVPSGSAAALSFNEGSGSSATDNSGNSNHGTITNGTWSTARFRKPRNAALSRSVIS